MGKDIWGGDFSATWFADDPPRSRRAARAPAPRDPIWERRPQQSAEPEPIAMPEMPPPRQTLGRPGPRPDPDRRAPRRRPSRRAQPEPLAPLMPRMPEPRPRAPIPERPRPRRRSPQRQTPQPYTDESVTSPPPPLQLPASALEPPARAEAVFSEDKWFAAVDDPRSLAAAEGAAEDHYDVERMTARYTE